ncbi:hypothetical protein D3C75_1150250 [compost metagenome]
MYPLEYDPLFDALDIQNAFVTECIWSMLHQPSLKELFNFVKIQRLSLTEKDRHHLVVVIMVFFFQKVGVQLKLLVQLKGSYTENMLQFNLRLLSTV